MEPAYSKSAHKADEWEPDWITYRFTVTCVCTKKECGEVAFVSGSGSVDQRYGYDGSPEYYDHFAIKSFFPTPRLSYIPPETPNEVEALMDKSFALYWLDVGAAANALRASLEALLNELKVLSHEKNKSGNTIRMTLHRRLEVWATTEKDYAELCLALKEVGNLWIPWGRGQTEALFRITRDLFSRPERIV